MRSGLVNFLCFPKNLGGGGGFRKPRKGSVPCHDIIGDGGGRNAGRRIGLHSLRRMVGDQPLSSCFVQTRQGSTKPLSFL